jgi:small redox-active disulfide protein 2
MRILVLGSGCANCTRTADLARSVAEEMAVDATVEKVTDIAQIMRYQVLATPGLVIDGKVVCAGRVPLRQEVMTWVADALAQEPGQ